VALTAKQKEATKKRLKKTSRKALEGKGVQPSESLDDFYLAQLSRVARTLKAATQAAVIPILNREKSKLLDAKDPLIEAVNKMQRRFENLAIAREIATSVVNKGNRQHKKAFLADVEKKLGIDVNRVLSDKKLKRLLDRKIDDNIRLIQSIPKEHFARVRAAILQGRRKKDTEFSIKRDLQKIAGITKNRAKLIARDQVSKLNGELNKLRQTDIGVTHYRWRTARDARVRPTHKANEGRVFAWSDPPPTGHPGEDVNCRCDANPLYDTIFKG
jgi:SPP1 gp7 family putative phage head morphogenesis protein